MKSTFLQRFLCTLLCGIAFFANAQNSSENNEVYVGPVMEMKEHYTVTKIIGELNGNLYAIVEHKNKELYELHKYDSDLKQIGKVELPHEISGNEVVFTTASIVDDELLVFIDGYFKKEFRLFGYSLNEESMTLSDAQLLMSQEIKDKKSQKLTWGMSPNKTLIGFAQGIDSQVKKEGIKKRVIALDKNLEPVVSSSIITIPADDKDDRVFRYAMDNDGIPYFISKTKHVSKSKQKSDYDFYVVKGNPNGVIKQQIDCQGYPMDQLEVRVLKNNNIFVYGWYSYNGMVENGLVSNMYSASDLAVLNENFTPVPTSYYVQHTHPSLAKLITEQVEKGKDLYRGEVVFTDVLEHDNNEITILGDWVNRRKKQVTMKPNTNGNVDQKFYYYYSRSTLALKVNSNGNFVSKAIVAKNQEAVDKRSKHHGVVAALKADNTVMVLFNDHEQNKSIGEGKFAEYIGETFNVKTRAKSRYYAEVNNPPDGPDSYMNGYLLEAKISPIVLRQSVIDYSDSYNRVEVMGEALLSSKELDVNELYTSILSKWVGYMDRFYTYTNVSATYNGYLVIYQVANGYGGRFVKIKL